MKKVFSIAAIAALLLSSCNIENPLPRESKVYRATIEDCQTRTSLLADGEILHVNWNSGDQIAITDGTNTAVYKALSGGSATTTFDKVSGEDPTGAAKAYYPVSIANGTLPSIQKYRVSNITESPMLGTIVNDNIAFKNLCGIVIFSISTETSGVSLKGISVAADKGLSGTYTVENDAAVVSGTDGVSLVCDNPVEIDAVSTLFHMALPAGNYSKFEVTAVTSDGKSQTLKAKSAITVERSKYTTISLAFNNFVENKAGVVLLPTGSDFATAVKALVNPAADATTVDNVIKKIVFVTNSGITTGQNIADLTSEAPAYVNLDANGVVTVSTPGTEFVLNADASHMFGEFAALEAIENIAALNTWNATDMSYMFSCAGCDTTALTSLDLSTFKTDNVITMKRMFEHQCALSDLNVNGWNTSLVEDMSYMFTKTSSLEKVDLSNWKNESCMDFSYMFYYTGAKEIDLTNFNTDNATTMLYMFAEAYRLETIDMSSFNTENVTDFGNMFFHTFNIYAINGLKSFDTSNATRFRSMFNRCDAVVELDCSGFDVSASTNCQYMFYKCVNLQKLDVSGFDLSGTEAKVVAYSMPKLQSIREINYGENFIPVDPTKVPDAFTMYYADLEDESMGCQNPTRTVNVYCSQDVADYLVTTDMHYNHNGWHYVSGEIDRTHQPITINMFDWKTNRPLNVTWPANERYPL